MFIIIIELNTRAFCGEIDTGRYRFICNIRLRDYACSLVHPEEQIIGHNAADVCAQGMPDAGSPSER